MFFIPCASYLCIPKLCLQIALGLNTAMLEKLQETDDLKVKLTQRLQDTRKEIEEAKQRKFDLEQALEEKK